MLDDSRSCSLCAARFKLAENCLVLERYEGARIDRGHNRVTAANWAHLQIEKPIRASLLVVF